MATFSGKAVSVTLNGKHNPQILTHDFLVANKVIPVSDEPFAKFLQNTEKPFTEFVSTPVIATLRYDNLVFFAEANRFQIVDERQTGLRSTIASQMMRQYFGSLLKFTPVESLHLTVFGNLEVTGSEESDEVATRMGLQFESLRKLFGTDEVRTGLVFTTPWNYGTLDVHVQCYRLNQPSPIRFTYEFKSTDLTTLLSRIDTLGPLLDTIGECLALWKVEGAP